MKQIILYLAILFTNTSMYCQITIQDSIKNEKFNKSQNESKSKIVENKDYHKVTLLLRYSLTNANFEDKMLSNNNKSIIKSPIHEINIAIEYCKGKIIEDSIIKLRSYNNLRAEFSYCNTLLKLKTIDSYFDVIKWNNENINLSYLIGYSWPSSNLKTFSFYNANGIGLSISQVYLNSEIEYTNWLNTFDKNDVGIKYHFSKYNSIDISYSYSLYHPKFETYKVLPNKCIDILGSYLFDKYLTDYLIKKQVKLTPLIQYVYQATWSYLMFSFKQSNTNFPFSKNENTQAITNSRFLIGVSCDIKYIFDNY